MSSKANCRLVPKIPVETRILVNTSILRHTYGRRNRRRFLHVWDSTTNLSRHAKWASAFFPISSFSSGSPSRQKEFREGVQSGSIASPVVFSRSGLEVSSEVLQRFGCFLETLAGGTPSRGLSRTRLNLLDTREPWDLENIDCFLHPLEKFWRGR